MSLKILTTLSLGSYIKLWKLALHNYNTHHVFKIWEQKWSGVVLDIFKCDTRLKFHWMKNFVCMLSWMAHTHASDTCPTHCRKLQIQLQIELEDAVVELFGGLEIKLRTESDTQKCLLFWCPILPETHL